MPHQSAPVPPPHALPPLATHTPLAGRDAELALIARALDRAATGEGHTLFLVGESGIGKTRLAQAAADEAARRGFTVAFGRAYPVDVGVPYAVFGDALLPVLREMDSPLLSLLSRGGTPELLHLFPALNTGDASLTAARGDPAELRTRLLWNFAQFLGRLAARRPLLLVLENLHWADRSSLELLTFTARQIATSRILIVGTINEHDAARVPALGEARRSLEAAGAATTVQPPPLDRESVEALVAARFDVERDTVRAFATRLFEWTRGNPFFVEETLRWLVDTGRLHRRNGTWLGWDVEELALPASARETVRARLATLGPEARALAELVAVIGTRATHDAITAVADLPDDTLLGAVDELRRAGVLTEALDGGTIVYDFAHPVLRETLYADAGLARSRALHERVAESLERFYAAAADTHAGELAFHYRRADARRLDAKAVRYLRLAGADALAKHAGREAAEYLAAALEIAERGEAGSDDASALVPELARARQRLGEYDAALGLWERALALADGDPQREAAIHRSMGLACFWTGRHAEAGDHFERGLTAARACNDRSLECRVLLAVGSLAQARGAPSEAERPIRDALAIAESSGNDALLAAAHRALLLLLVWTGPADAARAHGERAVAFAERAEQRGLAWSAHWALAMLAGLTGDAAAVGHHLAKARELADELRSPLLRVWTAEVEIEYAAGTGEWDRAVSLAEETVETARSLGQRTLLPRVLVWLGLLHFGRGEMDRGKACVDEAWALADADRADTLAVDVHTVVPAHTGRAAYHLAMRELPEAIAVGERGLAIADRSGYVVWAIHRLLPVMAEAALWAADMELARRVGARLRRDSERLGHRLGLAWADACDALVELLQGDKHAAVEQLRSVVTELEAIPFIPDAARVRRQLARALAETGEREEATRELRKAHEMFAALGANPELDATREQLRALGARPPARVVSEGVSGLTGREVDIVRLVAARKSNKEIGAALDISARTVSTHLSNIFAKLGVGSRGELTDLARREGIAE